MSMQIKSADVVRLILQFLKQNSISVINRDLNRSFETLQQESRICINLVDKKELQMAIMGGKWDVVLRDVKNMMLPEEYPLSLCRKLLALHQLVIQDMLDHDEREAATFAFQHFVKPVIVSKELEEKVMNLEYLCESATKAQLFADLSKQKMKEVVAAALCSETLEAPSERLLKLLGQSLKYQVSQGLVNPNIKLDLFTDYRFEFKQEQELIAKSLEKVVSYPEQSKIEVISFSSKGTHLAVGCSDGLIEIYDPNNYQVNTNLGYQNQGNFMFHPESISALAFNQTQEMLTSGDKTGNVKVWNVLNGKCLRKFETGNHPITAISFGMEPSHVLTCYETVQLYGLKSTTMLKQYKGHQAYINSLIVLEKNNQMLTCSKDGSIKCWNYNTQEEIKSYSPPSGLVVNEIKMIRVFGQGRLMICIRSNTMILSQTDLKGFDNLHLQAKDHTFVAWGCSGLQGSYLYSCVSANDQHKLYVHNSKTKRVEYFCNVDSETLLMEHHPTRNLLVTFSKTGELGFWRP